MMTLLSHCYGESDCWGPDQSTGKGTADDAMHTGFIPFGTYAELRSGFGAQGDTITERPVPVYSDDAGRMSLTTGN
jgi:hypothetical protein